MILPPATLGMLGGGQLGRYFVIAAQQLGYRVMVLDPDRNSPAARIADLHIAAAYDDREALSRMAKSCAAITTEFESVPAERWLIPVSSGIIAGESLMEIVVRVLVNFHVLAE